MGSNPFDRFTFKPERPGTEPEVTNEGVVTGEIGRVEEAESPPAAAEAMRLIEAEARKDALLAEAFDAAVDEDPAVRAALILDRINAMRRELAASDADEAFRRDRDQWLSDIANRLRELL